MGTLQIKDLCHELSFCFSKEETLLRKLETILLIEIAQLSQSEVNLLERVYEALLYALLFDLFQFREQLDKHLLTEFLTRVFICLFQIRLLFFKYLFEFLDYLVN